MARPIITSTPTVPELVDVTWPWRRALLAWAAAGGIPRRECLALADLSWDLVAAKDFDRMAARAERRCQRWANARRTGPVWRHRLAQIAAERRQVAMEAAGLEMDLTAALAWLAGRGVA